MSQLTALDNPPQSLNSRAMRAPRTQQGFAKYVSHPLFWVVAMAFLFGIPLLRSILRPPPVLPPVMKTLEPFALIREDGTPFGAGHLGGKVWIVGRFSATDSIGMNYLHQLEHRMRKLADAFELVAIATDAKQTAADLAVYAKAHGMNPRRFALLTGDQAALDRLQTALLLTPTTDNPDPLVLVDEQLRIRGRYRLPPDAPAKIEHNQPPKGGPFEQMIFDAALLVNSQ